MPDGSTTDDPEGYLERLSVVIGRNGGPSGAASAAEVDETEIDGWAHGRTPLPLPAAAMLCAGAGVSLDWLAGTSSTPSAARSDAALETAVRDAAQFVLKATRYFEQDDPDRVAEAIAGRVVTTVRERETAGTP